MEEIRKRNIPLVLLESYEIPDYPTVVFDYAKSSYEACEHLIKLGHKKIALIDGPKNFLISKQALGGYKKARRKYSLGSEDKMVRHGYYSEDVGYKLVKELLKNFNSLTAIITADDMIAAGAMKAIKEKGLKIPEDISVIGGNDMPIASYLDPPLTTMKIPFYEIGKSGAEMLINVLTGKKVDTTSIIMKPQLITRKSTGRRR